jgi:hypothetical protein
MGWRQKADVVTTEYTLFQSIVGLSSDLSVTHIPAGAVIEGPATLGKSGIVEVIYRGHVIRMLALDLQDGGRISSGDAD